MQACGPSKARGCFQGSRRPTCRQYGVGEKQNLQDSSATCTVTKLWTAAGAASCRNAPCCSLHKCPPPS